MSETRYSGEEVLAMLEQHGIDHDDLPTMLLREKNRRRSNLVGELYCRIGSGDYDVRTITDVEMLHDLVNMFVSSEMLLRDEVDPEWRTRADSRALAAAWLDDHGDRPAP